MRHRYSVSLRAASGRNLERPDEREHAILTAVTQVQEAEDASEGLDTDEVGLALFEVGVTIDKLVVLKRRREESVQRGRLDGRLTTI